MEKIKEQLTNYINYLEKRGKNVGISREELASIYYVEHDAALGDIVSQINKSSTKEARLQLLDNYIKQKELEKKSEEEKLKEALEKKFGVDLTNIDHVKLESGIDVIAFYDNRLGRKRLIDYSYAKSLVNEFTNIQNNNIEFQSDDYVQNSTDIAKKEASENDRRELEMIDINRVKTEYSELIKRIKDSDPKKVEKVNELVREAEKKNIKFINIENMVALDNKGNIIQAHYNEKKGQAELNSPDNYKGSVDTVRNDESVDQATSDDNEQDKQVDVEPTSFEEKEEIVNGEDINLSDEMVRCNITGDKEEVFNNIKRYSENMTLLDEDLEKHQITEEEFAFYEMMCEKYKKKVEQKNVRVKTLEYDPDLDSKGIISITLASIIVMLLAVFMTVMII